MTTTEPGINGSPLIYDAKKLLAEVADMVAAEKKKRGLPDQLYRP